MIRQLIDTLDRIVEIIDWIFKRYVTLILLFLLLFLAAFFGYVAGASHW